MVGREPDELRPARLADRLGDLLEFLAPGPFQLDVEVAVAQGVEEDQVDLVLQRSIEGDVPQGSQESREISVTLSI
jgi:hypothetical protein